MRYGTVVRIIKAGDKGGSLGALALLPRRDLANTSLSPSRICLLSKRTFKPRPLNAIGSWYPQGGGGVPGVVQVYQVCYGISRG